MTLLLDASAVIDLLLRSDCGGRVRQALSAYDIDELTTVAHLDAEVFSGLARLHRGGELNADEIAELLLRLADLAVTRMPITRELLEAAWALRNNIAARDALYVASAQALNASLLTTDGSLARAVPSLGGEL